MLPFSPVALNEEPIAEEASLIPVGRAVGAGRGLVGNQRRRGPARDSRANYTRAVAQAWPGTRGVEFAPDSPLEGGGFEPSVRSEEKAYLRCPQKELCSAWRRASETATSGQV